MAKWNINLSTTEPYNHIGLVKVRMDNTSEVFRAQVTENGKPYDFNSKGINKVYFNTKFNRFNTVQQEGTIVDAENGIIEYTLNDNDMQQTKPIQLAYFEFRKDDDYVDSTQTFGYHIMTSVYKECTDGQTYIVRLEELFKLYQDFMNQQQQDANDYQKRQKDYWEKFLEANREILESIDPGGKILTELIDSRDGEKDLKTRLDRDRSEVIDSRDSSVTNISFPTVKKRLDYSDSVLFKNVPSGFYFVIEHDSEYQPDILVTAYQNALGVEKDGLGTTSVFGGDTIFNVPTNLSYDRLKASIEMPLFYALKGEISIPEDDVLLLIDGINVLRFKIKGAKIKSGSYPVEQ